ncbi:MAG TPA: hypothetical protein VG273_24080 [Bryobacteraceae bacterium]|jgi:hypothetical protein|nr:hypothetical protein [Bryobacteraceae bacterium]
MKKDDATLIEQALARKRAQEALDWELNERETTAYIAKIASAEEEQLRAHALDFVKAKIDRLMSQLEQLGKGDPLRAEVEKQLIHFREQKDQLSAIPPIDRKGLATAWKATIDRDMKSRLGPLYNNFRHWRVGTKYKDDNSPIATDIVAKLAGDLKKLGIDVTRFGVR